MVFNAFSNNLKIAPSTSHFELEVSLCYYGGLGSEGQETGTIAPAPENACKKI
jgi:hypothetical protein